MIYTLSNIRDACHLFGKVVYVTEKAALCKLTTLNIEKGYKVLGDNNFYSEIETEEEN